FCVPLGLSQEVDDEHEFTYDVNSPHGPNHWGEIHPEWNMCNRGYMQSPIDLTHKRLQTTSKLERLDRDYKPSKATLVNRGHDMMIQSRATLGSSKHAQEIDGTIFESIVIYKGSRKKCWNN
ncbi:alpha carbonic anhydrase 7-like protein, partial [Tanacetum coccineum]